MLAGAAILSAVLVHHPSPAAPGSPPSVFSAAPHFDLSVVEDGWQPRAVTTLLQTHDGYLWLGTFSGLLRYDGVRFTVFDSGNTPGLQNSRITSLCEDAGGALWVGHETGQLSQFANGSFRPVPLGDHWPGGAIEGICADENHDLWLLNPSSALFRLRDGRTLQPPGGGSAARKALLVRAQSGQLWITANGKVNVLAQGQIASVQFKGSGAADFFQAAAPASNGEVWAVVNGALRKYRQSNWDEELTPSPSVQNPVTTLMETHSGTVLIGTLNQGLLVFAPGAPPLHFNRTNGLSHDWVRSLCEDLEGNIWVGTGAGLDTLRLRKVKMLNPPDQWRGRAVLSFAVKADGSAWIGTEGGGLYQYQGGEWTTYDESKGIVNLFVWSVLAPQRGELLVGTWGGGLLAKQGDRFEPFGDLTSKGAAVTALFEDSRGALWVGTTDGLFKYSGKDLAWSAGKEKLALPDVRAITETTDGAIWFGMVGGGLGSIRDGVLKQYRKQDGLSSDFVHCLLADKDDVLWIGTSDNGLSRWRQGKFSSVGSSQGLLDRSLTHLVDDAAGNLWMGSHNGILRASKSDLNRCADGQLRSVRCLHYGKAEGLASQNCAGGFQPGACRTADGLLWFPTAKGLAIIDPANVTRNSVKPKVAIEELLADGQPLGASALSGRPKSQPLALGPGRQRLEFRYTALSFTAPDKVRFRYKLKGLEQDWVEAGGERSAHYSYLRPGRYTFSVIACNNDEVWNETGASLELLIQPWFWQTSWFQLGALVLGAGSVGATVRAVTRHRVRLRFRQMERQQAVERERARIARDIHDDLGASLTRISMLSQGVRAEVAGQPQAVADVEQIYGTARELTRAMDEIVWAVNPKHDSLDSLVSYLGGFAQSFLNAAGIRCRLEEPARLPAWVLTSEVRHNVFLAFKEALHNVVKHASATEVRVSLEVFPNAFALTVTDNGCGFNLPEANVSAARRQPGSPGRLAAGNGLLNMRKRLEEVGGQCRWESAPGAGTKVRFTIQV